VKPITIELIEDNQLSVRNINFSTLVLRLGVIVRFGVMVMTAERKNPKMLLSPP
jgi:hypothetical protein